MNYPLPAFYDSLNVVNDARWIDYGGLLAAAGDYRRDNRVTAAARDQVRVGVLIIDAQNTFCHPSGELYVAGMSGNDAVDDSVRTVEWLYANLGRITKIYATLDTHRAFAVFHPTFLVDQQGNHPAPFTMVSHDDIVTGKWLPSPLMVSALRADAPGFDLTAARRHLEHYTAALEAAGRYQLTIWPFHGMIGDKGHALVSGLAEAMAFHGMVRGAQPGIEVKGTHPLVENYSILGPEVTQLFDGTPVARNVSLFRKLMEFDALVITGQAKSHCVAWTIDDLLREVAAVDPALARKIYLLEDCTTAIVVKDPAGNVVYDYGPDADAAFARFRAAGMHVVRSTDPIENWPDFPRV